MKKVNFLRKALLVIFSFIMFNVVVAQQIGTTSIFVVLDSTSVYNRGIPKYGLLFDTETGRLWQANQYTAGTNSLSTTSKTEITSKYALVDSVLQLRSDISDSIALLPAEWRSDISDSIAATHPTFAEILEKNNNAGDTTITGLRGFGNGTIESGGLGIANYGGVVNGMGIANYGGVVNGTGIAITNGVASGHGLQFATTSGSTSNSGSISMVTQFSYALGCDNSIALSIRDTLIGINTNPTFISLAGWHNKLTQTAEGNFTSQSILLASDSANVTNSDNFVGINLQNRTYEDLNNTTVIDRNLMLPGISELETDSVLYISGDSIYKGKTIGFNTTELDGQVTITGEQSIYFGTPADNISDFTVNAKSGGIYLNDRSHVGIYLNDEARGGICLNDKAGGGIYFNDNAGGGVYFNDDAGGGIHLQTSLFTLSILTTPPASATDTGIKGEIRVTATHIYVCVDTDTWVRSALSTW